MAPVRRRERRRARGSLLKLERASVWADAVFHVLAHVDARGAASCFSPAYRAWAEAKLGRARSLDEDARVLARLGGELAFASAQAIAWVFHSAKAVRAATDHELRDAIVDDERARAIAIGAGPTAEVLRAAAELELSRLEALGPIAWDRAELEAALARVSPAAPHLARCRVEVTPALALRGRVLHDHVYVGVPGIAGADAEHVAWQAAHEATVTSLTTEAPSSTDHLERRALGLLRSRARRAGLGAAHARWLSHLDLRAIGPIPDVDDAT